MVKMVWSILVSSKQKLDRRLVSTFLRLVMAINKHRLRNNGLLRSKLGGYVRPLIIARMAERLNPITDRVYAAETMYTNLNEAFGKRKF